MACALGSAPNGQPYAAFFVAHGLVVGMYHSRLCVDLRALRANYRFIASAAPAAGAVVKANAYGFGAAEVARALCAEGCSDFFVATLAEGLALRQSVAEGNVYVFAGPLDAAEARDMAAQALTPVLNDAAQVARWQLHRQLPVAVQVDTGMHRLGFPSSALEPSLFAGLNVALVMSHLANADELGHPLNQRQVERFRKAAALFPGAATSLGNSGGVLIGAVEGLARPGIALYGGNPLSVPRNPMRPVARLEARVVALRTVPAGEAVGYGSAYVVDGETQLAVLGIGYADGIRRCLQGAEVAYRGTRLPLVARVSMDMMHVDVTAVAGRIALGDWVEIFGGEVALEEVAVWANTINYEILTGIGPRVPRCYLGG